MNIDILKTVEIDYESGLSRFLSNASLYEGLLKEFTKNNEYGFAKNALEKKNYKAMFKHLHSMKGAVGNLAIMGLYRKNEALVEALRVDNFAVVEEMFADVMTEYNKVVEAINKAI